jgi:predicted membrane metal-binding protein
MPVIDAAGFLLGAVLLVAARLVPQLISPLAFWLLLAALACVFGVDLLLWFARGVHAIELDGDTLILRTGRSRAVRCIERASVRSVRSRRTWGGQMIEIRLQQQEGRGAGRSFKNVRARSISRLFRRDRVLLREDAFDRAEFAFLVQRLTAWEH